MANLKVAPHSLEAEKSTLGSILIDQDALIKIVDILEPTDFYVPANELVFAAILNLFNKRVNIDMITVTAYLQDHNQMESVGGAAYLTELVEEVPTSTNIFQYATIVQQKSTLRKLLKAGQQITALGFKEDTDVDSLLEDAEKNLFQVSQTFVKDKFIHIQDVLSDTYEKIADLHDADAKQKFAGIPYGFREIDKITTGLHPSDLIVLAARPSMGKTALSLNIAQNVAKAGKSVGIISLEMSKEQLVERLFCSLLEVDSWKIKTGQLQEQDFARIGPIMDQLNSLNIFIDDSLGNSVVELRAKTRRLQMEHGLDLLIIDYLQLMTAGKGGFSNNRVNEISEISRSLKSLARELNIPVIAMSQLSRAVEMRPNKEPVLSDLRDSGAIEQDADIVFMLYRHDYYYNDDSEKKGILDVLIRKHRNGALGQVELRFDKAKMKFYDVDRNQQPPPDVAREHSGLQVQAQEPMQPQHKPVPDF